MDFAQELARNLIDANRAAAEHMRIGREQAEREFSFLRRSLIAAYDRAAADPQTKIPTYLHAAIEALRK